MIPRFSAAVLIAVTLVSLAVGQNVERAKLDQFFDRLAAKNKAMGTVTIVKDGNVSYTRSIGYGQINGSEVKPLTAKSRFRIGSITKMFTAVMILKLVEDGRLKLNDPLDKFFPQIPNAKAITIEQVLAHRSGIHDSIIDPKFRPASRTSQTTKDELLAIVAKGPPDFEPGAKFRYSNSGFFLLGLIVEKLTGRSYEVALNEMIASKIGLKDTYIATGNIDVNKDEALTYFRLGNEWKQREETHPSILFGGGSIISTPNDLAIFIHALFDLKLVSKESLASMKTIRDGFGLGMESYSFAGRTFYGHAGGADNYGAWLAYLPEERLAVAYATNAKVYPVENIVSGAVEIYYNKPFQIPAFEVFPVSTEVLDKYVGVYSIPGAPVKLNITRQGTTLFFQPPGERPVALEATAENRFQIQGAVVIEFDAAKKQMTIKRGGSDRIFAKEN